MTANSTPIEASPEYLLHAPELEESRFHISPDVLMALAVGYVQGQLGRVFNPKDALFVWQSGPAGVNVVVVAPPNAAA